MRAECFFWNASCRHTHLFRAMLQLPEQQSEELMHVLPYGRQFTHVPGVPAVRSHNLLQQSQLT